MRPKVAKNRKKNRGHIWVQTEIDDGDDNCYTMPRLIEPPGPLVYDTYLPPKQEVKDSTEEISHAAKFTYLPKSACEVTPEYLQRQGKVLFTHKVDIRQACNTLLRDEWVQLLSFRWAATEGDMVKFGLIVLESAESENYEDLLKGLSYRDALGVLAEKEVSTVISDEAQVRWPLHTGQKEICKHEVDQATTQTYKKVSGFLAGRPVQYSALLQLFN